MQVTSYSIQKHAIAHNQQQYQLPTAVVWTNGASNNMQRLQRLRLVYTFWALKTKPQDLTESQNNSSNVGLWGSGNPSSSKRCTSSSQATARFGQCHWTRDAPETVPQCVSLPLMPSAWDSPIQLAGPFHCSMILLPCSYHVPTMFLPCSQLPCSHPPMWKEFFVSWLNVCFRSQPTNNVFRIYQPAIQSIRQSKVMTIKTCV